MYVQRYVKDDGDEEVYELLLDGTVIGERRQPKPTPAEIEERQRMIERERVIDLLVTYGAERIQKALAYAEAVPSVVQVIAEERPAEAEVVFTEAVSILEAVDAGQVDAGQVENGKMVG